MGRHPGAGPLLPVWSKGWQLLGAVLDSGKWNNNNNKKPEVVVSLSAQEAQPEAGETKAPGVSQTQATRGRGWHDPLVGYAQSVMTQVQPSLTFKKNFFKARHGGTHL